ncbi:bacteriohopanetetrol glucosamine biosynthesis glycosyltransferase HpnI [Labrys monachus]|uniref:Ceramide glucosyltransferase n=1 Tax=Labrys monachus TaxID=217067 RepID=A0ABU0FBH1_9HYPH|nr:bacteriohopanetetrol glucosamine biosynthesis glycosyltransferase HpnI [Labrys monachus]MDQ0391957.1 ceramide glucosyltransferase [Labrys monachus]
MGYGLELIFAALAAAGCIYWVAAAFLVARYGQGRAVAAGDTPLTILKPLHGAEPGLAANLASFLDQDYGGPVQIVFGVQDPLDPAIAVVEDIVRTHPDHDIALVVDSRRYGSNPKVSNLVNMMSAAKADILVLADSDIRVEPDYLSQVVAALGRPGVGAVTCAYRSAPFEGPWSGLSGLAVDSHFLPGVVVGMACGLAEPCFGATIALRRKVLERIGGFQAFADILADDYAIGDAVRRLGLDVAVTPFVVTHMSNDATFGEMMSHEMRWAKTVAGLNRIGFAGTGLTHPVPLAILALLLGGSWHAGLLLVAALACRSLLLLSVARRFRLLQAPFWLLPLRDCLSFYVYLASFFPSGVSWRGSHFLVEADGTMAARRESE